MSFLRQGGLHFLSDFVFYEISLAFLHYGYYINDARMLTLW